jgi:diguanylate cyclase (GGDEF)-like protein
MIHPNRQTIGVLIGYHIYEGSHPSSFAAPIIRGLQAAARDKDVNLMVACGVARGTGPSRHRPAWAEIDPEIDFVPVGPWNTDGLIFLGPVRSENRIRYVRRLVESGFPILIMGGDSGTPAVIIDNEGGIRQVMEHLIEHGHQSIAFIAGDEQDRGDSAARVDAYRRGVREFGLVDDPRLMEFGGHWEVGGYHAMRWILQSGAPFTAVMCSNDLSALGAIRALREAKLRIPWDISITGFDDILEGLAQVPPLTSVHYPLFETGYRTLLLLQKRIEQGPAAIPDTTRIATRLVARQSCGCLPGVVTRSAVGADPPKGGAGISSPERAKALTQQVLDALLVEIPPSREAELLPACQTLVEAFLGSVESGDLGRFQIALSKILQDVELAGEDSAHIWQSAVSVLRREAQALSPCPSYVEDLLHQARTLLSESIDRRLTRLQVARTDLDESIGLLTARLISCSDMDQVYGALRENLPQVGVRDCHVVFFEPQGEDPVGASRLEPLAKELPPLRFDTRQFPPPGLYPDDKAFSVALLPLFFQEENLGYAVFDGGNLDPLATLVRQLASSIKNVQLHAKVLELSLTDALTGVYNRRYFELLLSKENERSQRYKRDLAVIMIDIDRFKLYNDAYGHLAGDEALREIARCIGQGVRRGLDVVTRYGGEEFAVILPETGVSGAWTVAENVRRLVEGNTVFLQPISVSLGISALAGERVYPHVLLEHADRALYQAKSRGRNQTVVFEDWMREAAHFPPAEDPAGPADLSR